MIKQLRPFLVLLALLYIFPGQAYSTQLLDRIVALAGDDVIMLSELRDKARKLLADLRSKQTNPMPSERQIIDTQILYFTTDEYRAVIH